MRRLAAASAHLERQEVSYAPKPWEKMLAVGGAKSAVLIPGAGGCGTFDDFNTYDCTGGSVESYGGGGLGGLGEGGEGGNYPNNELPAFDPATGEGIDPNAPQVIIVGERPEQETVAPPIDWASNPPPMPQPEIVPIPTRTDNVRFIPAGCLIGPRGITICPPPNPNTVIITGQRPPKGTIPKWKWSDFDLCKAIGVNCPDPKKVDVYGGELPPPQSPEAKRIDAGYECIKEKKAGEEYCLRMAQFQEPDRNYQCAENVVATYEACLKVADDIYEQTKGGKKNP